MSDGQEAAGSAEGESTQDSTGGGDDGQARRKSMGDGIKEGLGVLSAFRDALEETIQEARERGDLSTDRAKEVMKDTLDKAQNAAEGARDRLDFATQADLETVKSAVEAMKDRLSELEESVFGASREPEKADEPSTAADEEGDGGADGGSAAG